MHIGDQVTQRDMIKAFTTSKPACVGSLIILRMLLKEEEIRATELDEPMVSGLQLKRTNMPISIW